MKKSAQPVVSVIIPTYNSSTTIIQVIESALNQTFRDIEVIVVDDGSIDDTQKVLAPLIESGRIAYVCQTNSGCGKARNNGLSIARGEFVALLDSDDYWLPEKIAQQIEIFRNDPGCVLVYTASALLDGKQLPIKSDREAALPWGRMIPRIVFHNPITLSSVMVRAETLRAVGGFTEDYRLMMFADYDLWLKLAPLGTFRALPQKLTLYQTRADPGADVVSLNHKKIAAVFKDRAKEAPSLPIKAWYLLGWCMHALHSTIGGI